MALGWNPQVLQNVKDYYKIATIFPVSGTVDQVIDGDTFTLDNGVEIRLLGINAPDRGATHYREATDWLTSHLINKRIWLEYDRDQHDLYGRMLAWVWINCEASPSFLPANYMYLYNNYSNPQLSENPAGCHNGQLINELMVDSGLAKTNVYKDQGQLKYQDRLKN